MKLHTSLTYRQVHEALALAQRGGLITPDVMLVTCGEHGSRTHPRSFDVQLGSYDKHSLPPGTTDQHGKRMRVRRFKNSGSHGATSQYGTGENVWSATWHEWGWFMAAIFDADPQARFGDNPARSSHPQYVWGYASQADFDAKTDGQFTDLARLHAVAGPPPQPPQPAATTPAPKRRRADTQSRARTTPVPPLTGTSARFTPAGDPALASYADALSDIDATLAGYQATAAHARRHDTTPDR